MISEIAQSRIYAQYRGKPKFAQWVDINGGIGDEFKTVFDKIRNLYDIDAQEGEQLDLIGRVVGVNRNDLSGLDEEGIQCGDDSFECGDLNAECSSGSILGNDALSNYAYKILLKSKVAKNTSDATSDSIAAALKYIFTGAIDNIEVVDGNNMSFTIEIDGTLDDIQRQILTGYDIVPRGQGIIFGGFLEIQKLAMVGDGWAECGNLLAECADVI